MPNAYQVNAENAAIDQTSSLTPDIHARIEDFANRLAEMNLLFKHVVHLDRQMHLELKSDNLEEKKKTFNHVLSVATTVCSVAVTSFAGFAGLAGASTAVSSVFTGLGKGMDALQNIQAEEMRLRQHGHDTGDRMSELHTGDLRDTIQKANDAKQAALSIVSENRRNLFDLVRSMANG